MYTVGKIVSLTLLASLMAACSVTSPAPTDPTAQNVALARWTQCLTRFTDGYNGRISRVQSSADAFCEGHKRDVLATFPIHLENQVAMMLSQKSSVITTARYLKTGAGDAHKSGQTSQLDTYRDRLTEARNSNL